MRPICRLWSAIVVATAAINAQATAPRFRLPEPPYDYLALSVPDGFPTKLLPERNGPANNPTTNAGAALGRVLFYDKLLSANRTRSCASCHKQSHAFADGTRRSRGIRGHATRRNSIGLANLAFHEERFFWDGRARCLEDAVLLPIQDPTEMGLPLPALVDRIAAQREYVELFQRAFGTPTVSRERIARALAQFVRSIVSLRSRFDAGLAETGDVDRDFASFSPAENRGKRLFFGPKEQRRRQGCAACHMQLVPVGFCGNAAYSSTMLFQGTGCRNNGVDRGSPRDDPGFARVTGKDEDRGKFRMPSLRNLTLTAPYMHDGRFRTLDQVVQFYSDRVHLHPALDRVLHPSRGGWSHVPSATEDPALPPGSMLGPHPGFPMDSRQRADLVAFLATLTDLELVQDPRFSDPFVR